jgi:hypothetical chaperone protein
MGSPLAGCVGDLTVRLPGDRLRIRTGGGGLQLRTRRKDELILIGDFGGGTSDFSILRVGPTVRRRGRTKQDIAGNDGVAVAGDAFDKRIIRKVVAPRLGMGSEYFSAPSQFLPVPAWPYERLERWHYLSFLNTAKNLEMLERIQRTAVIPERLDAFMHLIRKRLPAPRGRPARSSSWSRPGDLEFACGPISICQKVTRRDLMPGLSRAQRCRLR